MALFLCQAIAELILCSISAKGKSIIVYIYALLLKDLKNIEIKHEWKVEYAGQWESTGVGQG